jgi:hypothetical protein
MKNPVWTSAIKTCADPQRARHFLDLLAATSAGTGLQAASHEQARILAALFSGSQALSNLLVARPDWLSALEPELLKFPRRKQGLRSEVSRWLKPLLAAGDFGAALTRLREFKQREISPGWPSCRRSFRRFPTWPTSAWMLSGKSATGSSPGVMASPGTRMPEGRGSPPPAACWAWASSADRN